MHNTYTILRGEKKYKLIRELTDICTTIIIQYLYKVSEVLKKPEKKPGEMSAACPTFTI